MIIYLKNKDTLIFKDFKFKCCIGANGLSKKKEEGDKTTPKGIFKLGNLLQTDKLNHHKFKM